MLHTLPCKKRHPVLLLSLSYMANELYLTFFLYTSLLPVPWNQVFSYAYNTLTHTFFQLLPVLFFLIYTSVWFIVGKYNKARNVSTFSSWFSRPLLLQHHHYRSLTFVPAPCKWRWYGKMTRQWLMVVPVPQVVYWLYCWELTLFLSTSEWADEKKFDNNSLYIFLQLTATQSTHRFV